MINVAFKGLNNVRNISAEHLATLWRTTLWHAFGQLVTTCCKMLDDVRSSLKTVKFLLQHFWMLQDFLRVWTTLLQYITTRSNNDARYCIELLRAFNF